MRYPDLLKTFAPAIILLCAKAQAFEPLVIEEYRNEIAQGAANQNHLTQKDEQAIAPIEVKKVRAFLDRFVDPDKTPEEQTAFFADQVEYYNRGVVGKSTILHDVKRFVRYWPRRNYHVAEINYINADPGSGRIFVSYTIEFEVANKSRTISGRANYGALINALDDAPKIESIREKVVERKSSSLELD